MAAPRPGLGRPPRPAREWLRVATWREPALTVALPRRRRSRPAPQGALCAKPGAEEEAGPAAAGASPHKAASAPPSAAAAAASPPPPPKDAAKAAPLAPGPAASPPPPRPTEESVKKMAAPDGPGATEEDESVGALNSQRRRVAVHASRDSLQGGLAAKYSLASSSSERRLPTEGGPAAQKAAVDPRQVAKAVEGIALFAGVPKEDRTALYAAMYTFDYAPKEYIMRQGEEGRNFYVVVSGTCVVTVSGEEGATVLEKSLGPGDTFGEVALLHGGPRTASVRAGGGAVKLWVLGRGTFRQTLSDAAYARRKNYTDLLSTVKCLVSLTPYAREQLADAVVVNEYGPGKVILEQGSLEGARFHIVEQGSVRVAVGGAFVAALGQGDYFGELCLLGGAAPTATVAAASEGAKTISLDRSSFRRMLGEDVQEALGAHITTYVFADGGDGAGGGGAGVPASLGGDKSAALRGVPSPTGGSGGAAAAAAALAGLSLGAGVGAKPSGRLAKGLCRKDLVVLKELGVGMTGNVYLARVPAAGGAPTLAVIKIMSKVKMLRMNQVINVVKEKTILAQWTCPQIITSLASFQDRASLYLVLEFMAGGDLFQHLCDVRKLATGPARFYAAEVLLALGFIHSSNHVYRDLKPENILMDASGHVKLADMGFCKELRAGERTYTTCGTADYMAPEVMLCQGYNRSADYWAFGVLIYEMLTGAAPFAAKSDRERHAKILSASLAFPGEFNLQAKDCVSRLCVLDISHRLGMMAGGVDELQDHTFFAEVDWHAMSTLGVKPPFVPRVRSQADWDKREPIKLPDPKEEALHPEDEQMFRDY